MNRYFLLFPRLQRSRFILLLCLCCLVVCVAPARAATEPVRLILKTYDELSASLSPGGGVNWFNPGAYEIQDLGAPTTIPGGGYMGNMGIGEGVNLLILSAPGAALAYSPLYIKEGNVFQTGGLFTILPIATGQAGLYIEKGGYRLSGGELNLIDVGSTAIYLKEGDFNVSGGELFAVSKSDQNIIHLEQGNFTMSGGRVLSIGDKEASVGPLPAGIYILKGDFAMSGGDLLAKGSDGYGVYLEDGIFHLGGGDVKAEVLGGAGIYIHNGYYHQTGGRLWLSPTAATGSLAVYVDNSGASPATERVRFSSGAEVRTRLNLRDGAAAAVNTGAGHFSLGTGGAAIEGGANLNPWVDNSLGLARDTKTGDMVFLSTSNGVITGRFDSPADTMTLRYNYGVGSTAHTLSVERTAWASEKLQSRNARVASALEANAAWLLADPNLDHALNTAYSLLDLSRSSSEINRRARDLTPWGATTLSIQAVARMDMAQSALSDVLRAGAASLYSSETGETTATSSGTATPWRAWITPLVSYERYDAKTTGSASTDGWSVGGAAGFARRFEGGTLGLGLHFIHGRQEGGGWRADSDTTGVMAGFRTTPLSSGAFSPWLELSAGYAYSDVDQKRDDLFGYRHDSDLDQHAVRLAASLGQDIALTDSFRLTPILGFDYTYTRQDSFRESTSLEGDAKDMNLSVSSDEMHSYRPKIGAEAEWRLYEALSVTAHAFYRYELGDRQAELSSSYIGTPISFTAKGEKYGRSSGNVGAGFSWQATDALSLGLLYNLTFGDHYQGHQFDLALRYEF